MQTSRTGTPVHGVVVLIFDNGTEFDALIAALHFFATFIRSEEPGTAIDAEALLHSISENYIPSDQMYRKKPTSFLDDDMMPCLVNVTLSAVRKLKGQSHGTVSPI